ncbi:FRG domain-containing protein [Microbacterium oleivorans]|uniref:FRG domain-containing protein n=1 Tax=Microbacterium oleivorans TaxID=273677 RepID=UPI0033C58292
MNGSVWRDTGWYFAPSSASELMTAIARVGTHGTNHRFAWRGHADADYEWSSSLYRTLVEEGVAVTEALMREREERILDEARRWGLGVEGGQLVDDFQLLADLQHFGVPTRLVDVTSNPMTALWFATERASRDTRDGTTRSKPGLLIAMNMPWYREVVEGGKPPSVFKTVGSPPRTWGDLEGLSAKRSRALELSTPFVVSSSMPNARLRAQEGYFIASAHPDGAVAPLTSLSLSVPPGDAETVRTLLTGERTQGLPRRMPFVAILVPARMKTQLRDYLRLTYSRTAKALFPDYTGFRDHGRWRDRS